MDGSPSKRGSPSRPLQRDQELALGAEEELASGPSTARRRATSASRRRSRAPAPPFAHQEDGKGRWRQRSGRADEREGRPRCAGRAAAGPIAEARPAAGRTRVGQGGLRQGGQAAERRRRAEGTANRRRRDSGSCACPGRPAMPRRLPDGRRLEAGQVPGRGASGRPRERSDTRERNCPARRSWRRRDRTNRVHCRPRPTPPERGLTARLNLRGKNAVDELRGCCMGHEVRGARPLRRRHACRAARSRKRAALAPPARCLLAAERRPLPRRGESTAQYR